MNILAPEILLEGLLKGQLPLLKRQSTALLSLQVLLQRRQLCIF
jgi:hypothetical protein